jgi:hypothetical protein
MIEEVFKESEKYKIEYMKMQEERCAIDIIRMREALQKEMIKIQGMKDEVAKPNWRKITGDIIANEIELKTN